MLSIFRAPRRDLLIGQRGFLMSFASSLFFTCTNILKVPVLMKVFMVTISAILPPAALIYRRWAEEGRLAAAAENAGDREAEGRHLEFQEFYKFEFGSLMASNIISSAINIFFLGRFGAPISARAIYALAASLFAGVSTQAMLRLISRGWLVNTENELDEDLAQRIVPLVAVAPPIQPLFLVVEVQNDEEQDLVFH